MSSIPAVRAGTTLPLACVPGAIPAGDRRAHFALAARLFREAARDRRELPGGLPDAAEGYAFRFDADAFDDAARFVANERRCCPFLTFALDLAPAGGPLWLRLTGPVGTRAFLEAELPLRP